MATYSSWLLHFELRAQTSALPGESPWTEELGGLQSMGSQRGTTEQLSTAQHIEKVDYLF